MNKNIEIDENIFLCKITSNLSSSFQQKLDVNARSYFEEFLNDLELFLKGFDPDRQSDNILTLIEKVRAGFLKTGKEPSSCFAFLLIYTYIYCVWVIHIIIAKILDTLIHALRTFFHLTKKDVIEVSFKMREIWGSEKFDFCNITILTLR